MADGGKLPSHDGKLQLVLPMPQSTKLLIPPSLSPVLSTHLITYSLIIFMSIRSFNAQQGFNFIMASAKLLPPSIHLISAISLLSYNCHKHIRSTISRFSCVVPSLTKQSYKDFKSVQRVISSRLSCRIFSIVALIAAPVSNLWAILYSLDTKTLCVTHLHLINDQQRMLALLSLSISVIIKPIQENRSWLLAKDKSIKIINLRESLLILSWTKRSPREGLSIYHYNHLLSYLIYSFFRLIICATKEKLKGAFSWQTVAI